MPQVTGQRAPLVGLAARLFPRVRDFDRLQRELRRTRARLQAVIEDHESALEQLDRKTSDLRNLFESSELATVFLDRNIVVRGYTAAMGAIFNLNPSDLGRPLTDLVSQLRHASLREDVRHVLDSQQPLERRVAHEDGERHFSLRILPYRDSHGCVVGALVTFLDVTSIVKAERHQHLLIDELNHRVKNMLTVVISLASQTMRRSASMEEFGSVFMGRIEALTASYSLLSRAQWVGVALRDVLEEELRPFRARDRETFDLSGPHLRLTPQGALALGMAIHELATNAVKHGALSQPGGQVTVVWRIEADGGKAELELVLDWAESGGPPVRPPARRGFGATLIERGFAHELSGSARLAFEPDGVRATLRAPTAAALAAPPMRAGEQP